MLSSLLNKPLVYDTFEIPEGIEQDNVKLVIPLSAPFKYISITFEVDVLSDELYSNLRVGISLACASVPAEKAADSLPIPNTAGERVNITIASSKLIIFFIVNSILSLLIIKNVKVKIVKIKLSYAPFPLIC